jgi:hypothetical protein
MIDLLAVLAASARLKTEDDVIAFEQALADLPDILGYDDVRRLLEVFRDDTEHPEVMFALVHRVEATDRGVEERAVVSQLAALAAGAPGWAEVIVMRLLNDETARVNLISLARHADAVNKASLTRMLQSLSSGSDQVARYAADALVQLS